MTRPDFATSVQRCCGPISVDVRLHQRRQMQLRGVLDVERIRHEGEHRIGAAEFREAALLGRIVDGRQTSRRPAGARPRRRSRIDPRSGCASPAPPGYPGAQNTRVASDAANSVLMRLGYHSPARRTLPGRQERAVVHECARFAQGRSNFPPRPASAALDRRRIPDPDRGGDLRRPAGAR